MLAITRSRALLLISTACVLAAAGALAPGILHQHVDNRIEQWVRPDSAEAARYERFKTFFGSDEFIIIAYSGLPLFTAESLGLQVKVLERLEGIDEVHSVFGIPAVYRDTFGMEDRDELEREILSTPFYRDFVLAQDGTMAGLVMQTLPPDTVDGRRRLMHDVRSAVTPFEDAGWTVYVVGPPALNVALDQASDRESGRLLPTALSVSSAVLLLMLGSVRALGVAMAGAGLTMMLTVGAMAAFHRPFNMVTTSMPALVWVLSLSNIIHLVRAYYREVNGDVADRIAAAISRTWRPCLISSVTTAFGFLSLAMAPIRAVVDFGLFAGFGLLMSFVVAFSVVPVLLWVLRPACRIHVFHTAMDRYLHRIPIAALRHRQAVLLASAAVILATPFALANLRLESNPLDFLSNSSETSQAYETVARRLTGLYSLEVVLDAPQPWTHPAMSAEIDGLASDIESYPGVARVLAPTDYLRKLNQWDHGFDPGAYTLPKSEADAERLLDEMSDGEQLHRFVTADGSSVRLCILVNEMDSETFLRLARLVDERLARSPLKSETTGVILQLVRAQNTLVNAQAASLGLAFLLVFPCLLAGLRSVRLTAISVAPNVLPVLAGFVLMAVAGIPLDAATIMMAGIALGIAVDDSVHVMWIYQKHLSTERSPNAAVILAMRDVSSAIATTTVTALTGFSVLIASEFAPLRSFGLIAGLALVIALIADLTLLPVLLVLAGVKPEHAVLAPIEYNVSDTKDAQRAVEG